MNCETANCTERADGLDGLHCQECWESICAQSFWQMIDELTIIAEEQQS